jgi:acyl-CoA synthetase (AMP-forming)/AMP-acid ligase II
VQTAAVVDHARAHLAGYKCPKDVYLVDDLPRTGSGKVRRSRLAAELLQDVDGPGDDQQHEQDGYA